MSFSTDAWLLNHIWCTCKNIEKQNLVELKKANIAQQWGIHELSYVECSALRWEAEKRRIEDAEDI